MGDKKLLDPLNQADWEKFGEKFRSDLDAILESAEGVSAGAVIENGEKGINQEATKKNEKIRRKENLSEEEKSLASFLDYYMDDIFSKYNIGKKDNTKVKAYFRRIILKRMKDEGRIAGNPNVNDEALEYLRQIAENRSTKGKAHMVPAKIIAEYFNKKEEKSLEPNEFKMELTPEQKEEAIRFFNKEIFPLYEPKKDERGWEGSADEAVEFLKENFIATANEFNYLDGDEALIRESWKAINEYVGSKIREIENKGKEMVVKEVEGKKEKTNWTLDEVIERLKSSGADENDINFFFSLHKEDRMDFLNSSDEELVLRIEKLKEIRETNDKGSSAMDREELDKELKTRGDKVAKARKKYVEKESEIGIKISRLKNFFRNLVSIDKNYEIEKELEEYKKEYEHSLKDYLDAVVDIEKPADEEEREIIYRYAQFGETLRLLDAKEDLKFENNPRLEKFKKFIGSGTASFLDKYKNLLGKPKELIMKKTDSKILGFGGGMIAVGGAMAFAANYVPGLRGFTRVISISIATKGFYSRAESKAVIKKEKSLVSRVESLENRLAYIDDLGAEVDEVFKKELSLAIKNIPKEAMKEREEVSRRMGLSFLKAIAVSTVIYELGNFMKGYFHHGGEHIESEALKEAGASAEKTTTGVWGVHGGEIHQQPSHPTILNSGKSIEETMREIDVKSAGSPEESHNLDIGDAPQSKEDIFRDMGIRDLNAEENSMDGIQNKEIKIVPGRGIKDTLAKFLASNHDKLTEGKMGWDPNKYTSVEEWADKRAIGIVGELKAQHSDYNFDKVSTETSIKIDLSDKSDIKIVDVKDPYHLGGHFESQEAENNIEKTSNAENLRENILEEAQRMTENEMKAVYLSGISIEDYAKINNLTVEEFLNDKSGTGAGLREIISTINEAEADPTNTISNVLKSINNDQLSQIVSDRDLTDFRYGDYLNSIIREELKFQLPILKALSDVRDSNINVDNFVLKSFKEAVKNTIGFDELGKNQTVREFLRDSVKRAYELGEIDEFRLALSKIKL